jgi:NAD(P)-dependent dehydrogenase (short-subunit alcohol dehydrogenase family)
VTGASTGIGRACVKELVRNGFRVWATVRTDVDEDALRRAYPNAVSVLRLDLTDPGSVEAAGERVRAAGPLHGLVNNASVALPGPLEYMPIETFPQQIEIIRSASCGDARDDAGSQAGPGSQYGHPDRDDRHDSPLAVMDM